MSQPSEKRLGISPKALMQLAAPHTWPAAFLPAVLGAAFAWADGFAVAPWRLLMTLITGVLLQAAVNTLNDYRDFVSGLDTAENCTDETDAALIYETDAPKSALIFGLFLLACAALPGAILTYLSGPALLLYAGAALLAIVLYTLPKKSFSSLPLGELLSGIAMGGVLTCASYHVQAGSISPRIILLSVPPVITIACIMLVNNISDIEKDKEGGRSTFPVRAGRRTSQRVLRIAILCSAAAVVLAAYLGYPNGIAAVPVFVIGAALNSGHLFVRSPTPELRVRSMGAVLSTHNWIVVSYISIIILHCLARG